VQLRKCPSAPGDPKWLQGRPCRPPGLSTPHAAERLSLLVRAEIPCCGNAPLPSAPPARTLPRGPSAVGGSAVRRTGPAPFPRLPTCVRETPHCISNTARKEHRHTHTHAARALTCAQRGVARPARPNTAAGLVLCAVRRIKIEQPVRRPASFKSKEGEYGRATGRGNSRGGGGWTSAAALS
jgi:hypothetical protein